MTKDKSIRTLACGSVRQLLLSVPARPNAVLWTMRLVKPLLGEAHWGSYRLYPPRIVRKSKDLVGPNHRRAFGTCGKSNGQNVLPVKGGVWKQRTRTKGGPMPAYYRQVKEGKIKEDGHQIIALNVLQEVRVYCRLFYYVETSDNLLPFCPVLCTLRARKRS